MAETHGQAEEHAVIMLETFDSFDRALKQPVIRVVFAAAGQQRRFVPGPGFRLKIRGLQTVGECRQEDFNQLSGAQPGSIAPMVRIEPGDRPLFGSQPAVDPGLDAVLPRFYRADRDLMGVAVVEHGKCRVGHPLIPAAVGDYQQVMADAPVATA